MIARSLLAVGLLAGPISTLTHRVQGVEAALLRSATMLLTAVGFAGILATVRYFQRLTLRIPDGRLFAALDEYFYLLLIIVLALTAFSWFSNLLGDRPPWIPTPLMCVMVTPLLMLFVAMFRFFSICRDLAEQLGEQAKTAQKLWPVDQRAAN